MVHVYLHQGNVTGAIFPANLTIFAPLLKRTWALSQERKWPYLAAAF